MRLGCFTMRLQANSPQLLRFLTNIYRDAEVRPDFQEVTDVHLSVRAPSVFRRYFRPQVIPDPGFIVPAVPLPTRLTPLSFEMGLNLAIALKCYRYVSLHAAVVADGDSGILISAQSGGGKSTLAAALMAQGYRLLSDEFGLVSLTQNKLHAYPRPVSLKGESIEIVREFTGSEWMSETYKGTPKGDIAYRRVKPDDIESSQRAVSPKLLLFPRFSKGVRPEARMLDPSEAMMRLIPASTNYHLLGEFGFRALTSMVNGARAYEIQYGSTEQSFSLVRRLAEGLAQ